MKFDLKTPCKNCPFANTPDRITFANRDRAEEIEEIAYRDGFVCHEHSTYVEDGEDEYFDFGEDGEQHCMGALIMYLQSGCGNVPFENLSEEEQDRIHSRIDIDAPVFENETAFLEANECAADGDGTAGSTPSED